MALACCAAHAAEPSGDGISVVPRQTVWQRVTDADAWSGPGHWRGVISPYTRHWRYSEEHRDVYAVGIERQCNDMWFTGASYFSNSFGQPSGYLYLGHRNENLLDVPQLFFQWSAGMMYGYRGKFEKKVPLNVNGFSPGALITLGWQFDRQWSVAAHALGDAGVMFQLAYDLR